MLRHDRGLTATEQDAFSQWLVADPRHRAAWAEHRWGWDELDRLAGLQTSVHAVPDPDLLKLKRAHWFRFPFSPVWSFSLLAAAAVLAVGLPLLWQRTLVSPKANEESRPLASHTLSLIERRALADGSVVELNRGAVVTECFTPRERRVRLDRGEAHFQVTKDAARPFVVEAAGVDVRAVGTAFNVRLESAAVEVLVTEGKVGVERVRSRVPEPGAAMPTNRAEVNGATVGQTSPIVQPTRPATILAAGERAFVSIEPAAPVVQVGAVSPAEIATRLAWQPRLLDFTNTPLAEIVAAFNRHNPVRLSLADPSLAQLRLSATFRSDNVEGFVRLMTSDFGMHASWRSDTEIVLAASRRN